MEPLYEGRGRKRISRMNSFQTIPFIYKYAFPCHHFTFMKNKIEQAKKIGNRIFFASVKVNLFFPLTQKKIMKEVGMKMNGLREKTAAHWAEK